MADGTSPGQALSYFFGPSWDSERVTIRANHANLGRSYYPLAGYWTGDRKGPFGEVRLRPLSRLEIFASGSEYRSTAQPQDNLPILKSTTLPVGASLTLPWQMTASAQWSTGSFTSFDPGTNASQRSDNRQWTATLSRPIQRHSLRFMARDMRLVINGISSRERSGEFEDTFQAGHFAVSGALRVQRAVATDDRNSLYARASAQWSSGRVTASGFFERGKDLANQTVFATSTTNSTVLNVSVRATREWTVQAEAFRTRLLSQLNPDSLFVQSGQSLATNALLSRFQQWTFLFRVGRTFHWGSAKPGVGLDQYTAEHMPIKGWVEGAVYVPTGQGRVPAPEVVVRLETGQFAVTDAAGWYRFTDVPEGGHVVSIDVESLPADFNPGQAVAAPATVGARKVARADFEVYRLGSFSGRVNAVGLGPESVEGIGIRLTPGGAYTTTDKDGAYAFHNVREGAYDATVDELTLPDGTELPGGGTAPVIVRYGGEAAGPVFEMQRRKAQEKPVRKMFDTVIPIKFGN
jgi:hypothetical protein